MLGRVKAVKHVETVLAKSMGRKRQLLPGNHRILQPVLHKYTQTAPLLGVFMLRRGAVILFIRSRISQWPRTILVYWTVRFMDAIGVSSFLSPAIRGWMIFLLSWFYGFGSKKILYVFWSWKPNCNDLMNRQIRFYTFAKISLREILTLGSFLTFMYWLQKKI